MKERKENDLVAIVGTIGVIILGIIVFSAKVIDWASVYLVGLMIVVLFFHIKYNVRKS